MGHAITGVKLKWGVRVVDKKYFDSPSIFGPTTAVPMSNLLTKSLDLGAILAYILVLGAAIKMPVLASLQVPDSSIISSRLHRS